MIQVALYSPIPGAILSITSASAPLTVVVQLPEQLGPQDAGHPAAQETGAGQQDLRCSLYPYLYQWMSP